MGAAVRRAPARRAAGPLLYRITELDDDRLLLWMEDVDAIADAEWTLDHYRRAATALGGLAARRSTPELLAGAGEPGWALRMLVGNRVMRGSVPALADDRIWAHPLVVSTVDARLRDDLRRIAAALPEIMDRLDALPQALAHGDASPQNLLAPRGEPGTFVAIDVAFQCPLAIGFDLGQLLVGLAHAGHVAAAALPAIHDVLVPAYLEGMRAHGVDADPDAVAYGYVGGWPPAPPSPRCRTRPWAPRRPSSSPPCGGSAPRSPGSSPTSASP
ncbi:hypothetical protein ACFQZ4_38460 [Catellatospora coxensis]